MVNTWYVDPTKTGGSNNGTDADNAWLSIQTAISSGSIGAGDTIYCVHRNSPDETPNSSITFTSASGTVTARVNWIGVNSLYQDDGTRYEILGSSIPSDDTWDIDNTYQRFKNFYIYNSTDGGIDCSSGAYNYLVFENVYIYNTTNSGINNKSARGTIWIRCRFSSCGLHGYRHSSYFNAFIFCTFDSNDDDGLYLYYNGNVVVGCVFFDNVGAGVSYTYQLTGIILNSVFDNNSDGIEVGTSTSDDYTLTIIGNRFSYNSDAGIDITTAVGKRIIEDYNFFSNNTNNTIDGTATSLGNSLTSGTLGYTNRTGKDFTLTDSATLRRVEVNLP